MLHNRGDYKSLLFWLGPLFLSRILCCPNTDDSSILLLQWEWIFFIDIKVYICLKNPIPVAYIGFIRRLDFESETLAYCKNAFLLFLGRNPLRGLTRQNSGISHAT